MKTPKTFIPEKGLEYKVGDLKSQDEYKIRNLMGLILWPDSDEFESCTRLSDSDLMTRYKLLNPASVEDRIEIKYENIEIHAFKFVDDSLLKENKRNIYSIIEMVNKKNNYVQANAITKDKYVIFLYTFLGDCDNRNKFINAYKRKFKFKELKQ